MRLRGNRKLDYWFARSPEGNPELTRSWALDPRSARHGPQRKPSKPT